MAVQGRRRRRWVLVAALALLLPSPLAVASTLDFQSRPPTSEQVAIQIVEAWRQGDARRIRKLATREGAEPWREALAVLATGAHEAATIYASAVDAADAGRLVAYVASRDDTTFEHAAYAALWAVLDDLAGGDAERALTRLEILPPSHDPLLRLLLAIGEAQARLRLGELEEVLAAWRSVAAQAKALGVLGAESKALRHLADFAWRRGHADTAARAWEQAAAVDEVRGNLADLGAVLGDLAMARAAQAKFQAAHALFERAVPMLDEHGDPRHALRTRHHHATLIAFHDVGLALDRYEENQQRAVELGELQQLAGILSAKAYLLGMRGDQAGALSHYEEALRLAERLDDTAGVSETLLRLAEIASREGRFEPALDLARRAQRVAVLGRHEGLVCDALCARGTILHHRGSFGPAVPHLQEALRRARALGLIGTAARCLEELAAARGGVGQAARALDHYAEARALRQRMGDVVNLAVIRANEGLLWSSLGRLDEARAAFSEARDVFRARGVARNGVVAQTNLGNVLRRQGRVKDAVRELKSALRDARGLGLRSLEASIALGLGAAVGDQGAGAEAEAWYEYALEIGRDLGAVGPTWSALAHLANCQRERGELDRASALGEEALALVEAAEDAQGQCAVLAGLAKVHWLRGHYDHALRIANRAVGIARRSSSPRLTAGALGTLVEVHVARGAHQAGVAAAEEALALAESADDLRGLLHALNSLGQALAAAEYHEQARSVLERAVEVAEQAGTRSSLVRALGILAQTHGDLGAPDRARTLLARATRLADDMDHGLLAAELGLTRGIVEMDAFDFDAGMEAFRRVREFWTRMENPAALVAMECTLAIAYRARGKLAEGIRSAERALELALEHRGKGAELSARLNLGRLYDDLGDPERALAHLEAALRLAVESGSRGREAGAWESISIARENLGDLDGAMDALETANRIYDELGYSRDRAIHLLNLGARRALRGDAEGAFAAYQEALEVLGDVSDPRTKALILVKLGALESARGNLEDASAALAEAERIARKYGFVSQLGSVRYERGLLHLRRGEITAGLDVLRQAMQEAEESTAGLAADEAPVARAMWAGLYELGVRAMLQHGTARDLLEMLELTRAGALREMLGERGVAFAQDLPEELRRAEREARADVARAHARFREARAAGHRRTVRERMTELENARIRLRNVTARIQREARRAAQVLTPRPETLDTVRGRLAPGDAFAVFAVLPDVSAALVLTREDTHIVPLGSTAAIREAASALLLPEAPWVDPAAVPALRALIVDPLGLGPEVRRVLVSPDGVLSFVPLSLLFPEHTVAAVPSATVHGILHDEQSPRGEKVLALGDPDYGNAGAGRHRGPFGTARLSSLPGTRQEALAVGDVTLLGQDASEARLTATLPERERWRAVHLACHGLVDPVRPLRSALALTPDPENDGLLSAFEVFRLKFPADLVVLSACDTARGRLYEGEGVVGLVPAFLYAGTPRVLSSLWKVDDEATRALMTKFYELWNPKEGEGLSAAEALRKAQAHVAAQERWAHPYYWAAWVLWGLP